MLFTARTYLQFWWNDTWKMFHNDGAFRCVACWRLWRHKLVSKGINSSFQLNITKLIWILHLMQYPKKFQIYWSPLESVNVCVFFKNQKYLQDSSHNGRKVSNWWIWRTFQSIPTIQTTDYFLKSKQTKKLFSMFDLSEVILSLCLHWSNA